MADVSCGGIQKGERISMSSVKEGMEEAKKGSKGKPDVSREEKKETVMYIGPSIKNVVSTGTLYRNGLPEALKKEMEKQPVIKSLIVPVSGLARAQRQLATPGSALAVIYGKVKIA